MQIAVYLPSFKCPLSQINSSSLGLLYKDHDPHDQEQDEHKPFYPHSSVTALDVSGLEEALYTTCGGMEILWQGPGLSAYNFSL